MPGPAPGISLQSKRRHLNTAVIPAPGAGIRWHDNLIAFFDHHANAMLAERPHRDFATALRARPDDI